MLIRLLLTVALLIPLYGCAATFESIGPGQDLYSPSTSANTNKLATYFADICAQVNLVPSGTALSCSTFSSLVQAGFNDIDQRCNAYLDRVAWQRLQAVGARSSLTAIGSSMTTGLTLAGVAGNTVAFAAEALGLTASLYDANNYSMLAGLDTNTILTIVANRRTEFRRQFGTIDYTTTPQMVYALRTYLRICSPQTIALDANTNAMYVAAGIVPPSIESSVQEQRDAIVTGRAPVTPLTQADVRIVRPQVTCPKCGLLFENPGYADLEVKQIQTALCVKADGDPGDTTFAALQNYRTTIRSERRGGITRAEFSDILTYGCKSEDPSKGIANFFEAATMRDNPNQLKTFAANLNLLLPGPPQLVLETVTFSTPDLRKKVAEARALLNLSTGSAVRDTQISRELLDKVGLEALN